MGGAKGRQVVVVVEDDESPVAEKLFDGSLFNLTELLRQGITLGLPTQPLHSEACKGLCPVCGCNLNNTLCQCDTKPKNPALAKLAELLEKNIEK